MDGMRTRRGFTLIELLVVIAIIGLLSSVVLASLNTARERARNASYLAQAREYMKALAVYHSVNGSYPGTTAWGCIGTGYPGGICWSSTHSESNATAVAFRAALDPYIDTSVAPGPKNLVYGPMYRTNSTGYNMILIFEGGISCPLGSPVNTGAGLTRCDLTNQGL